MNQLDQIKVLLDKVSNIPGHRTVGVDRSHQLTSQLVRGGHWLPDQYIDFCQHATTLPEGWEFFGLTTDAQRFYESNQRLRELSGSEYTFFGVLSGDYGLAFRNGDPSSAVYLLNLYANEPTTLDLLANSLAEWICLEIGGYCRGATAEIALATNVINRDWDDRMLDPAVGRMFSKVALYWSDGGRLLKCDAASLRWCPQRPPAAKIDPSYVSFWEATDFSPAVPEDWHLCCPKSNVTSGSPIKPQTHLIKRIMGTPWTLYGTVGTHTMLLADGNKGSFATWDFTRSEEPTEYVSFSEALRWLLEEVVRQHAKRLAEVEQLLEVVKNRLKDEI
jgi:hypothetical protein